MSTPRISVNKLGEYVQITNALRRRRIVESCKFPQKFITTRYSDAREFMKNFFTKKYDDAILENGIKILEKKPAESDFQAQDNELSVLALESLSDISLPDLSAFDIKQFGTDNIKLKIKGVDVSVFPDLIIRGKMKKDNVVGAIKFHLSKSNPLLEEGQKTVATVLKKFVEDHIARDGETTHNAICFSIDVFNKKCDTAPNAFKIRMNQVEVACEEIALWWDKIKKSS